MASSLLSDYQEHGQLTQVPAIALAPHPQLLPKNFGQLRRPSLGQTAWQADQDKPHPVDQKQQPE